MVIRLPSLLHVASVCMIQMLVAIAYYGDSLDLVRFLLSVACLVLFYQPILFLTKKPRQIAAFLIGYQCFPG